MDVILNFVGDSMKVILGNGIASYGDSLTVGYSATNNYGYSQMLGTLIGGMVENYGVGSMGTTEAVRQAHLHNLVGYRGKAVSIMAGLNDIRSGGATAYEKIANDLRAFLVASLLRTAIPASSMGRVGAWTAQTNQQFGGKAFALGGTPMYTSDTSAYTAVKFYGESFVVGAYATSGLGHYQDLDISIDGGDPVRFEMLGKTNVTASYAVKVFQGLGDGAHVARIRPINNTPYSVLDYVGTLMPKGAQGPIFVGLIPYIQNWTQYGSIATREICDAANSVIASVVAEFDGYDVVLVDPNKYYDPATQCSTDGIHPTSAGHTAIFNAFAEQVEVF